MTNKVKVYDVEVGQKFGKLIVQEIPPRIRNEKGVLQKQMVRCVCECGKEITTRLDNVICGKKVSCGCVIYVRAKDRRQRLGNCEYPNQRCAESWWGKCCWDCDKRTECEGACLNTPDRCVLKGQNK